LAKTASGSGSPSHPFCIQEGTRYASSALHLPRLRRKAVQAVPAAVPAARAGLRLPPIAALPAAVPAARAGLRLPPSSPLSAALPAARAGLRLPPSSALSAARAGLRLPPAPALQTLQAGQAGRRAPAKDSQLRPLKHLLPVRGPGPERAGLRPAAAYADERT